MYYDIYVKCSEYFGYRTLKSHASVGNRISQPTLTLCILQNNIFFTVCPRRLSCISVHLWIAIVAILKWTTLLWQTVVSQKVLKEKVDSSMIWYLNIQTKSGFDLFFKYGSGSDQKNRTHIWLCKLLLSHRLNRNLELLISHRNHANMLNFYGKSFLGEKVLLQYTTPRNYRTEKALNPLRIQKKYKVH